MLKKVLDNFAKDSHATVYGNGSQFLSLRWRTAYNLCPLQAQFNVSDYSFYAKKAGLTTFEIRAVILWADTGKWPTFDYYT